MHQVLVVSDGRKIREYIKIKGKHRNYLSLILLVPIEEKSQMHLWPLVIYISYKTLICMLLVYDKGL